MTASDKPDVLQGSSKSLLVGLETKLNLVVCGSNGILTRQRH